MDQPHLYLHFVRIDYTVVDIIHILLDGFVADWEGLIDDESFFDGILEPVVNRCEVDEAVIGHIVDNGYGYLEERAERARELESQQEIIGRVWD